MPDKNQDKADQGTTDDTAAKGPLVPDAGQSSSGSASATQSGPLTWSSSGRGSAEDTAPPPPPGTLDALRARLGADLDRYGLDLVRRALGEMHIAALGGTPASALAREVADKIEAAEASWFNDTGREEAQHDFASLNNRGTLTP